MIVAALKINIFNSLTIGIISIIIGIILIIVSLPFKSILIFSAATITIGIGNKDYVKAVFGNNNIASVLAKHIMPYGDINNPKRVREIVSIHGIYEIGHLELVFSLMKDVLSLLREEYPDPALCALT